MPDEKRRVNTRGRWRWGQSERRGAKLPVSGFNQGDVRVFTPRRTAFSNGGAGGASVPRAVSLTLVFNTGREGGTLFHRGGSVEGNGEGGGKRRAEFSQGLRTPAAFASGRAPSSLFMRAL